MYTYQDNGSLYRVVTTTPISGYTAITVLCVVSKISGVKKKKVVKMKRGKRTDPNAVTL